MREVVLPPLLGQVPSLLAVHDMTLGVTTTIHCDGCTAQLCTSWTLGTAKWSTRKRYGWRLIRASGTHARRDYCGECVKKGRAK